MANKRAVASGNWSNTATWDGGTLPLAGDFVCANNFTVTVDVDINVGRLTTAALGLGVAGGTFTVSTTRTITLTDTSAIVTGTSNTITYSGAAGTTLTLNAGANVGQFVRSTTTAVACVAVTSSGTMNATGLVPATATNIGHSAINISGANSVVSFTGNIFSGPGNSSRAIITTVACTLTVIGNIISGTGNDGYTVFFGSTGTFNITGDLSMNASAANRCYCLFLQGGVASTTVNITGNLTGYGGTATATTNWCIMTGGNNISIYITGTATGGTTTNNSGAAVIFNQNPSSGLFYHPYLNVVGPIIAGVQSAAISISSITAINLFTGPFIYSTYGFSPISVNRMHYIVTPTSYIQFRDSSTNGAISPGPVAPAAYMYDPSTIADAPTANNVRSGVVYALGSQTGTLVVPAASSVASGVVFDNGTIGTAVLTASAVTAAVWSELVANLTTPNSIGKRLSTASTVQTTGAQISSLIGP